MGCDIHVKKEKSLGCIYIQYTLRSSKIYANLYLTKNEADGKLTFVRLSVGKRMIGAFIGWLNHAKFAKGIEIFTNKHGFAIGRNNSKVLRYCYRFSGSVVEPFHTLTARLLCFYLIIQLPVWIQQKLQARRDREMEEWVDNYPYEEMIHEEEEG